MVAISAVYLTRQRISSACRPKSTGAGASVSRTQCINSFKISLPDFPGAFERCDEAFPRELSPSACGCVRVREIMQIHYDSNIRIRRAQRALYSHSWHFPFAVEFIRAHVSPARKDIRLARALASFPLPSTISPRFAPYRFRSFYLCHSMAVNANSDSLAFDLIHDRLSAAVAWKFSQFECLSDSFNFSDSDSDSDSVSRRDGISERGLVFYTICFVT